MFVEQMMGGEELVVVDVGAANGLPQSFLPLAAQSRLFLFEPNPVASEQLVQQYAAANLNRCKVMPYALSGTGGRRKLRVTNTPTGSSLLEVNPHIASEYGEHDYFYPVVEQVVETRTLACVMDEQEQARVDMIKLDTQGSELDILTGLDPERLERLTSVEIEVGMPGAYKGQPGLHEVQAFLLSRGLALFDLKLERAHRPYREDARYYRDKIFKDGGDTIAARVLEVDAVFLRDARPLLDARDVSGVRRLMVAYCAYRFFPEAYHLAGAAQAAGLFSDEAAAKLRSWIVQWHALLKQRGG